MAGLLNSIAPRADLYTDGAPVYRGMGRRHRWVNHDVGQYVDGQAHTNGLESFWSLMKRGYHGIYHHMSAEHLHRYVAEFSGRHNDRVLDTARQMELIARRMDGKRLRYQDLIGSCLSLRGLTGWYTLRPSVILRVEPFIRWWSSTRRRGG